MTPWQAKRIDIVSTETYYEVGIVGRTLISTDEQKNHTI